MSYGFDVDTTDTARPRQEIKAWSDGTVEERMWTTFPKNTTERLGLYYQDTITLTEKWSLIPGMRYDYYNMVPKDDELYDDNIDDNENILKPISDSNVSWRFGTIYEFTDNISAYFQYSQGFKVPPYDLAYFYQLHGSYFGGYILTIPSLELLPEESESFEIGIRGDIGNFSYNLSAYRTDYDNFIQIVYVETIEEPDDSYGFPWTLVTDVYQYQNIDQAEISGVEFRFDYYLGRNVSMFLNGQYMDSEDKSTGEQLTTIQPFSGTLGLNYFRGNFSMDAMLKYSDDMDKNPEDTLTTDSWTTVDLFARYDLNNRFMLSVGVMNLFDKEYIEYSTVAGITDDGRDLNLFTEPGRTFSANLKFIF
jgi:hemoglobin/transferrin/lactoferrin receptor protein